MIRFPWCRFLVLLSAVGFTAAATDVRPHPSPLASAPTDSLWVADSVAQIEDERLTSRVEDALVRLGASTKRATPTAAVIYRRAKAAGVDPFLVTAVVSVENPDLEPTAVSSAGAIGLMQVMPSWRGSFKECGPHLNRTEDNICTGIQVLKTHLADAQGSLTRGLLAYNGCSDSTAPCGQYPALVLSRYHRIKPHP